MTRPNEPDTTAAEEDKVHRDAMRRSRINLVAGLAVTGLIIIWPMIPGSHWVDHHVYAPLIRWILSLYS